MSDEVEVTFTFCGGDAEPDDEHLLADIVAVDNDIIAVIAERERRKRERRCAEPYRRAA